MTIRRCGLALALFLSTALPPCVAVNPGDNDAGSGGDAGDTHVLAFALAPGAYAGRVTPMVDRDDFYAIQVEEGDLLRVTFDARVGRLDVLAPNVPASGSLAQYQTLGLVSPGATKTFLMDTTQTVYLRVQGNVPVIPTENPYTFTFDVEAAGTWASLSRESGWLVAELHAAAPTDLHYELRATMPTDSQEPWAFLLHRESDDPTLFFSLYGGQTGLAQSVHGAGVGTGPAWGPEGVHVVDDFAAISGSFPAFQGHMRLAAFHTSDVGQIDLRLGTRGAALLASTEGQDLFEWSSEDAAGPGDVVTPVLASQGPREVTWDVEDRFLGVVDAWFAEGEISGPTGTWALEGEDNWGFLRDASAGPWRTNIVDGAGPAGLTAGPLGLGPGAATIRLAGFELPALGVAPMRLAGHEDLDPVCRETC